MRPIITIITAINREGLGAHKSSSSSSRTRRLGEDETRRVWSDRGDAESLHVVREQGGASVPPPPKMIESRDQSRAETTNTTKKRVIKRHVGIGWRRRRDDAVTAVGQPTRGGTARERASSSATAFRRHAAARRPRPRRAAEPPASACAKTGFPLSRPSVVEGATSDREMRGAFVSVVVVVHGPRTYFPRTSTRSSRRQRPKSCAKLTFAARTFGGHAAVPPSSASPRGGGGGGARSVTKTNVTRGFDAIERSVSARYLAHGENHNRRGAGEAKSRERRSSNRVARPRRERH